MIGELPDDSQRRIEIHPDGESYLAVLTTRPEGDSNQRRSVKVVKNWTAKLGGR